MLEALATLDRTDLVVGAVFVMMAVLSITAYFLLASRFGPKAKFRKRLAMVAGRQALRAAERPSQDAARRKEMQDKLKELEDGQKAKRRRYQIRHEIQRSGLGITVRQYAAGSVLIAFLGLILTLLMMGLHTGGWLAGALVAVTLGLGFPKFFLGYMGRRRIKTFTKLFPDAIDIIVRGIQSGLPVGECLAIISRESPEPIAGEFRQIVEGTRIGLTLDECLGRAVERVPSQELKFFAIVLQIQQQTGGNLAETLSNLSNVLRQRKKMKDKAAAMAAEANTSAAIIGSLPILVTGALGLINPAYIGLMFTETYGIIAIVIGLVWMTLGAIVMKQMVNIEI